MGAKSTTSPGGATLKAALDDLFAAPLASFVPLRAEIASRLRKEGHADLAKQVAATAKPTRTAWALNQVALRQPKLVEAVALSRETAAAAQKGRSSDAIAESARRHRSAIGEVVRAAGAVLAKDGSSLSTVQARRMGETLRALAVDEVERQKLMTGRLTRDVSVEDPFAGIEDGASPRSTTAPSALPSASPERDRNAKAEIERVRRDKERADKERADKERAIAEARAEVAALELSIDKAREVAAEAERSLWRAQSEAKKSRGAVASMQEKLKRAKEHLRHALRA